MVQELFDIFEGPLALPNILLNLAFGFLGFFVFLGLYQLLADPFQKLWRTYLSYADAYIDWKASVDRQAFRTVVPATFALVLVFLCLLAAMPYGTVFPLVRGLERCHLTPENGVSYAVYRLGRAESLSSYLRECFVVGPLIPSLLLTSWNTSEHPLQRVFACQRA